MDGAAHGAARNAQLAALHSTYSQLGKQIASSARVIHKAGRVAAYVPPHRILDNRTRSVPDTPLVWLASRPLTMPAPRSSATMRRCPTLQAS
eukprot:4243998-Prymnesium_polylepis.1